MSDQEHNVEEAFQRTQTNLSDADMGQQLKMEFPFDLNNLFSLQYSFDQLKQAIEWLAKSQNGINSKILELEARPIQTNVAPVIQQITETIKEKQYTPPKAVEKKATPPLQVDIEVTRGMFDDLKALVDANQESQKQDARDGRDRDSALEGRMTDAEAQIELLKKMGAPAGDGDSGAGLLDALNDITDKLRKDLMDKLDDLTKRLEALEIETKAVDEDEQRQIDELQMMEKAHQEQLDALAQDVKVLKHGKVEQDDFDRELEELRALMGSMGTGAPVEIRAASPKGPKVTQDDIDRWNAAAEKTDSLQILIDKLLKETKDFEKIRVQVSDIQRKLSDFVLKEDYLKTVNDLRNVKEDVAINKEDIAALAAEVDKLKDILARMQFPSIEDFNLLRGRVDSLENQLATLRKALGDLEKKMKGVRSGGGADNGGLVDKCVEELNTLRAEFEAHRDEANRNLDQLNAEMPTKADKKDLLDLENRIMDKLRDMIQQILNQFANKEDVMKRFAQLSKKIREIMDLLAKQGTQPAEDDAMFSKKHLGPLACASCEKNLVNMYGQAADYHVWKKLPFRDPSERIARYGQGFSKILSHMRPGDLLGSSGQSPTRNAYGASHHQSVDDSHLPNYQHHQSQSTNPETMQQASDSAHHPNVYKTAGGFFRPGKTQGAERRNGSTGRDGRGFGTVTTNPGTSVDEAQAHGRDHDGGSPYVKAPGGGNAVRFGPGKHNQDGMQGSTETLPKLTAVRTAGHSAAK